MNRFTSSPRFPYAGRAAISSARSQEGEEEAVRLPIPKGLERRLQPLMKKGEDFLREWEWSWTKAFVAGIVVSFAAVTTLAIIPSWMLIFADTTLQWRTRLFITIRDLIVLGWVSVWMGVFVITAYQIQVIRKRVRGERQSERYSGGYR